MEQPLPQLIRSDDLAAIFGVCRSTIWKWARAGKLPQPIRISDRVVVWRRDEVEQWIADRPAA